MLLKIIDSAKHVAVVDIFYDPTEKDRDGNSGSGWWWVSKTPGAFPDLASTSDKFPLPAAPLGQDDGRKSMVLYDWRTTEAVAERCTLHNFGLEVIATGSTGVISAYRQNGGILKVGPMKWLGRFAP